MDRNAAITAARALIEAAGLTAEDLFPAPDKTLENTPNIDDLLPRNRWMPEPKAEYFYCDDFGGVGKDKWDNLDGDNDRAEMGNIFPSGEDAEEHAANILAWIELRERSNKPAKGWLVDGGEPIPGVGFSSPALRDIAVNHIGQDRIDKLARWIWNVKD